MRQFKLLGFVGFVLAGCGSNGGETFDLATFKSVSTAVDARFEAEGFTSAANLPNTGSASYRGFVAVMPNPNVQSVNVGNARLEADFGAGEISMTSSDFAKYEITATGGDLSLDDVVKVEDVSGSLSMNNGAIKDNALGGAVFEGTVTGTVDGVGYNLVVDGFFVGQDADAIMASGVDLFKEVFIEAERD